MKIIYLITQDQDKNLGITRKVESQVNAWRSYGHTVEIFNIVLNNSQSTSNVLEASLYTRDSIIFGNKKLFKDLSQFKPDIVYLRFEPYKPFLLKVLKNYRTVIEINTDDVREQNLLAKDSMSWKLRSIYNKWTRHLIFMNVKGIVSVTQELLENENFSKYRKPGISIPNTIETTKYPLQKNNVNNNIPQLYFMGNFNRRWHGVNKIIELARLTENVLEFHIVGGKSNQTNLPKNIKFYGYLNKDEYNPIMNNCDICIGSLAFHEIPLNEACPLKVREYLATGFPLIIGYKDSAFLESKPEWLLEIPNTTQNVTEHKDRIVDFCIKYKNVIIDKEQTTNYIDSTVIEKRKISFFEELCQ